MALTLRCFLFPAAGLRRSFRLSRKDRQGSSGEGSDPGDSEYLTYEEVTRFQQKPHERPRLVVLIGEDQRRLVDATGNRNIQSLTLVLPVQAPSERE